MFVLLEHSGAGAVHWDLAIEIPGQTQLATWRLLADPGSAAREVPAEPIADHDPRFLDYEGPLRKAPGRVRRVDRGAAVVERYQDGTLRAVFTGTVLRGTYEIGEVDFGGLGLRRVALAD